MSIKKLMHANKRKNRSAESEAISCPDALTDAQMQEMREYARENIWAYSVLPSLGFPCCFWPFY